MPQHAHRNAHAVHEERALVEVAVAIRVHEQADATLGSVGHRGPLDIFTGRFREEEPPAFIQRAEHRVRREVGASGQLHAKTLRHAERGEAGGWWGRGVCHANGGYGGEKAEDKGRGLHARRITAVGRIATIQRVGLESGVES